MADARPLSVSFYKDDAEKAIIDMQNPITLGNNTLTGADGYTVFRCVIETRLE